MRPALRRAKLMAALLGPCGLLPAAGAFAQPAVPPDAGWHRPATPGDQVLSSPLEIAQSRPLRLQLAELGTVQVDQDTNGPGAGKRDSLWNGLLIGAGLGALLGLIPDYYDDCEECHDSQYCSIAVGAGVGVLVDALRTGGPAPHSRMRAGPVDVGVAVGRRRAAVRAAIRWP